MVCPCLCLVGWGPLSSGHPVSCNKAPLEQAKAQRVNWGPAALGPDGVAQCSSFQLFWQGGLWHPHGCLGYFLRGGLKALCTPSRLGCPLGTMHLGFGPFSVLVFCVALTIPNSFLKLIEIYLPLLSEAGQWRPVPPVFFICFLFVFLLLVYRVCPV